MPYLVLLRHGESLWNLENRFTGWTDVDLTDNGEKEARKAGILMRERDMKFDVAFTSVLKRAIRTLYISLYTLDQLWIPVHKSWRLNERHYGALQGLNKFETGEKYGEDQLKLWRRSYDVSPPALTTDDDRYPGKDPKYKNLSTEELPLTECLRDCLDRFYPYWHNTIKPELLAGKNVLIVAHGNTLRALVEHLDNLSNEEIMNLNIPTGSPLVYHLHSDGTPCNHEYL